MLYLFDLLTIAFITINNKSIKTAYQFYKTRQASVVRIICNLFLCDSTYYFFFIISEEDMQR